MFYVLGDGLRDAARVRAGDALPSPWVYQALFDPLHIRPIEVKDMLVGSFSLFCFRPQGRVGETPLLDINFMLHEVGCLLRTSEGSVGGTFGQGGHVGSNSHNITIYRMLDMKVNNYSVHKIFRNIPSKSAQRVSTAPYRRISRNPFAFLEGRVANRRSRPAARQ